MNGSLLLVLLLAAGAAVVGLARVEAAQRPPLAPVDSTGRAGLLTLRRTTTGARFLGVLLAVGVGVAVGSSGSLGRGLALAPAAFAVTVIATVLLGDVLASDTAKAPGVAGLEVRRLRDYVPSRLMMAVAVASIGLVLLLGVTMAIASPDDLGRDGRTYSVEYECDGVRCSSTYSPFPGSFYGGPMLAGLAATGGLALVTAMVVVRRPRNGSDPGVVAVDDAVRTRSVTHVVAAFGAGVAASLVGVAGIAAQVLASSPTDTTAEQAGTIAALVLLGLGLVVGLWSAAQLLSAGPAPRLVRSHAALA